MKKIVSVFLSIVMMLCIFSIVPFSINAATGGKFGSNLYWSLNDEGVLTISGKGRMTTTDQVPWINNKNDIRSVVIEYGVTSIRGSAFSNSENVVSITIPDSVTSIGDSAFFNCKRLENIHIPYNVSNIGYDPFHGCDSLFSITVDEQNNYYCSLNGNLYDKEKTRIIRYSPGKTNNSFTIPFGVNCIENAAFYGCFNLKTVIIPNSVTSILFESFSSSGLTQVVIPNSVTSMGEMSFFLLQGFIQCLYF